MSDGRSDPDRVDAYLEHEMPNRNIAGTMLLRALPKRMERFLDLGTGEGRLLAVVAGSYPNAEGVGIDASMVMMARAAERFSVEQPIELRHHDLHAPLEVEGSFSAVVSGLAIHHLSHTRKRRLFSDVYELLAPGGVFANLDLVASATPALHKRFRSEIGQMRDDPEDQLAGLGEQLEWLREAGFEGVDCQFKWLELALMVATRPGDRS